MLEHHPLSAEDPLGRALYGEEPILCERVEPAVLDGLAQDPAQRALLAELAPRSAVLVPLRFGDGARGLVLLATTGERALDGTDRALLGILARRVSAAYEVDRLRAEDRRTTGYFRVLSEAGRLFAESLDLQATLDAFVRLSVPELADAVALNMVDYDGVNPDRRARRRDEAHRPLLARLRDAYVVERTPRRAARLFVHDARERGDGDLDRAGPAAGAAGAGLSLEPGRAAGLARRGAGRPGLPLGAPHPRLRPLHAGAVRGAGPARRGRHRERPDVPAREAHRRRGPGGAAAQRAAAGRRLRVRRGLLAQRARRRGRRRLVRRLPAARRPGGALGRRRVRPRAARVGRDVVAPPRPARARAAAVAARPHAAGRSTRRWPATTPTPWPAPWWPCSTRRRRR